MISIKNLKKNNHDRNNIYNMLYHRPSNVSMV